MGVYTWLWAWNDRPEASVQMQITIIVDATYIINGMKPHMRKTMLEGEKLDPCQIIYDEYDEIKIKPEFCKIKWHIEATQAILRQYIFW